MIYVGHRRRQGGKKRRDLARQQVRHCRRTASVRHVNKIDACFELEKLAGDVRRRVRPRTPECKLAGMRLRVSDEFGDVVNRERFVHYQANGQFDRKRQRRELGCDLSRIVFHEHRSNAERRRTAQQQRGAVRLRTRDGHCGKHATAARPIVDR